MYFPDLSIYQNALGASNLRHVGWLDKRYEFPRGITPQLVVDKLRDLLLNGQDVHRMRGHHLCEFCGQEFLGETYEPASIEEFKSYLAKTQIFLEYAGKKTLLGMSEIWIRSSEMVYAAPSMIYHYIVKHNYLPPIEFIDAVTVLDSTATLVSDEEVLKWMGLDKYLK